MQNPALAAHTYQKFSLPGPLNRYQYPRFMMRSEWWPGENHEAFTEWAMAQGVEAFGVAPARFPGRGLGMIATRKIKKGDVVVQVPTTSIFTMERIPASFKEQFPEGTAVQTIMAAYFTHGSDDELAEYELWRKAWPTRRDFEDSLPLLWPAALGGLPLPDSDPNELQAEANLLTPCISGKWPTIEKIIPMKQYDTEHQNLLLGQDIRLRKAWAHVTTIFPETDWRLFSYYWLIINTRSFYWVAEGEEPPNDRNDAMAMLPFADYFNHADIECDVKFNAEEYTLRATEDYEVGDEVYMSYGGHPNDFLLAEYGFILDKNESDCIYLDEIILRDLNNRAKEEELLLNQYYGNYQLTSHGVCYRTEVAACLKYMNEEDWRNHILEGSTEGVDEKKTEAIIEGWIRAYAGEADAAMKYLQEAITTNPVLQAHRSKAETLLRRWTQIKKICNNALSVADQ
ncbi:hypothetical protein N7462_001607 [Penicillium macrosclerotiorum]|uniref:uncharacterized protein n=1 Tax=Penicillium macrosclerotiorum TaxID=303699 RepID=UPI0025481F9E|nr:uncharacterized protein N7462_001607 [Penicillium macrosclerotiorum]KAJ5692184.1 hypothetical protein N7462_001607 [Penicillium macrosclerotiorum]